MATGTVRWFNDGEGIGWIAQDEGGPDIFVRFSEMRSPQSRRLRENDRVENDLVRKGKPPHDENVGTLAQ